MSSNIEGFPFSEVPGTEVGRGYESIVKELGPNWVIKEFNPLRPDGTAKYEKAYENSQTQKTVGELQETQRILQQATVYGEHIMPTEWVLGQDAEGNPKYFTIQKRFAGETLKDIMVPQNEAESYSARFTKFFNENPELRTQMIELLWGTKSALVETGVFPDFHLGNIALTKEIDGAESLKIFDLQNMVKNRKLLYEDTNRSLSTKLNLLGSIEKHVTRLEKYHKWLGITEDEKKLFDQKYNLENNLYENTVDRILTMSGEINTERDIPSEVLTQISGIYPFLNEAEYNSYMEKAT